MNRSSLIRLALIFSAMQTLSAQDFRFGKVSKAELQETVHYKDSSAVAAYLYKYRRTYFNYLSGQGFKLFTDVHERIKIYDAEGFDYATKKIRLYRDGGTREALSGIKAYTYYLEDGKVKDVKLGKDGQFSNELSEHWEERSFTMPNLKEGSVVEYKYQISSPFLANVDEFVFQHDIPINKLESSMEMPEYFNFRVNGKGFLSVVPKMEKKNTRLNVTQRVSNGDDLSGPMTSLQRGTLEYKSNLAHFDMVDVPALKEEPYVGSINNYRSGMKYELNYTKFPNSPMKQYATDWEAVVKSIYQSTSFGAELKKSGYFEKELEALILGTQNDAEKLAAIFNFVKSKAKWNGHYGKYVEKGVRTAYKEHVGNAADINLMLTAMLRHSGLDANPVLVSTRQHGIPLFPTREGYNYVISGVALANGMVLLDATDPYSTPNVLPFRVLNWEGRMIRKDGSSSVVNLYPNNPSSKKIFCNVVLDVNGDVSGKLRVSYSNHDAIDFRKAYYLSNEEDYLNQLEQSYGDIEINNFSVKNSEHIGKNPVVSYEYNMEEALDIIGDKIYFSPMFFLGSEENPFKLEVREYPVDFGYPSGQDIISSINLPEGYKIETLPEPIAIGMPDGMGSFKFEIQEQGNMIQMKVSSNINQSIIPSTYYAFLKEYYKKMIEKMNEKVVLSKV